MQENISVMRNLSLKEWQSLAEKSKTSTLGILTCGGDAESSMMRIEGTKFDMACANGRFSWKDKSYIIFFPKDSNGRTVHLAVEASFLRWAQREVCNENKDCL